MIFFLLNVDFDLQMVMFVSTCKMIVGSWTLLDDILSYHGVLI